MRALLSILDSEQPWTVFDVGANRGVFVQMVQAGFPNAHIHAFEPDARAFAELAKLVSPTVHVNRTAVAAACAPAVPFNLADDSCYSHLAAYKRTCQKAAVVDQTVVPVTTIDQYRIDNSVAAPDIIKIDAEGAEADVLRGAGDTLDRVRVVAYEWGLDHTGTKEELDALLEGFEQRPVNRYNWLAVR